MAFYRGEQGNVKFTHDADGTLTAVTAVRSFSLSIEKESLDVTAHGDSFRDVVGSLISGSERLSFCMKRLLLAKAKVT